MFYSFSSGKRRRKLLTLWPGKYDRERVLEKKEKKEGETNKTSFPCRMLLLLLSGTDGGRREKFFLPTHHDQQQQHRKCHTFFSPKIRRRERDENIYLPFFSGHYVTFSLLLSFFERFLIVLYLDFWRTPPILFICPITNPSIHFPRIQAHFVNGGFVRCGLSFFPHAYTYGEGWLRWIDIFSSANAWMPVFHFPLPMQRKHNIIKTMNHTQFPHEC